jgi:putative SOS response-associated peptidase YedK
MRRLFRVTRDSTANLLGLSAVFPDMMAPVVRVARDGARELRMMRCGFPPPPIGNAPVTNVRNLKSPTGAAGSRRNGAVSCQQPHFANGRTAAQR